MGGREKERFEREREKKRGRGNEEKTKTLGRVSMSCPLSITNPSFPSEAKGSKKQKTTHSLGHSLGIAIDTHTPPSQRNDDDETTHTQRTIQLNQC